METAGKHLKCSLRALRGITRLGQVVTLKKAPSPGAKGKDVKGLFKGHLGRPDLIMVTHVDEKNLIDTSCVGLTGEPGEARTQDTLKGREGHSGPLKDQARKELPLWTREGNGEAGLAAFVLGLARRVGHA